MILGVFALRAMCDSKPIEALRANDTMKDIPARSVYNPSLFEVYQIRVT